MGQKGVEIWGWKRFGRDERIHGLAYCSIIGGVEKQCISLTRVGYTNRWEALVVSCADSELTYNKRGWTGDELCVIHRAFSSFLHEQ